MKYLLALFLFVGHSSAEQKVSEKTIAAITKQQTGYLNSGKKRYNIIFTSKSGQRYFVSHPGACSCAINIITKCSKNLEQDLAKKLAYWTKHIKNAKCPSNAGCSMGWETYFVECPSKP